MLDKKEYPMKEFLPAGLFILDTFKHSYNTGYDRRVALAVTELYGHRKALLMLRVHWGNKISLALLALLFIGFVGMFTEIDGGYLFFCVLILAAVIVLSDRELNEKVKKRRQSIQLEFPDFVNKLTLLVNAGLTVSKAWEKAAFDAERQTPLYKELRIAVQAVRAGASEYKAYEEFAKRCHVPAVTRFVTVVLQNIRKGNSELVPVLRLLADECWEMRKNTAKKFGEEASTKLLLPMMLMFIAILLIVGMPAVLALRNI
ncbi:MAG TPA: type II secretion system F family protein [Clostridiales bacterium]|nr:type II secretion system F family protein [Clostridiales bacterium]